MLKYIPVLIASFLSVNAAADSLECTNKITQKLKQIKKDEYQLARQTPTAELNDYARRYEITCPWTLQFDLDGDKRTDWAGLAIKNGTYYLIAQISNFGKSQLIEFKQYNNFPENMYLSVMTVEELKLYDTQLRNIKEKPKFVLIENKLSGLSQAYQWNGKTMYEVGAFESESQITGSFEN